MSSCIPSDLLLSSPEEAADKLATYMVLSRQAGGFTKSAAPWYEDVGSSVSDFWDKNVAGPAQSFGETAGGAFSEYWDKYVDSVTGGGGPAAQTLALAGTGAGLGGIYGLVSELARNKKERRWENPLLYAGLGGAIGGGAGLAYHNIPGLKDTVDETFGELRGDKRTPPTEVAIVTAINTPEGNRTPGQKIIVADIDKKKQRITEEISRGVVVAATNPRALADLAATLATGQPSPEFVDEFPALGAISGTLAGKGVSMALTGMRGLRQQSPDPTTADKLFGGIPSAAMLQEYLGSVKGIDLDDAMITRIQNELARYSQTIKGRTRGRLPWPAGGMPGVWVSNAGEAQVGKPGKAERAKRVLPPRAISAQAYAIGGRDMFGADSIVEQLKAAHGIEEKAARSLAKGMISAGAGNTEALELLVNRRHPVTSSGLIIPGAPTATSVQLSLGRDPVTGVFLITAPELEGVAKLTGETPPQRVTISGRADATTGEVPAVESIMRAFRINQEPAGRIQAALETANREMAARPDDIENIRSRLNNDLHGVRSSRRFPLEATYVNEGAGPQWKIVETIKPVLRMRSPRGGRFGVQLPFHRVAPKFAPWGKLRSGTMQRAPGTRILPSAAPIIGGLYGAGVDINRSRHNAATLAAIRASRAPRPDDKPTIWDKIIGLGREDDKPRQRRSR